MPRYHRFLSAVKVVGASWKHYFLYSVSCTRELCVSSVRPAASRYKERSLVPACSSNQACYWFGRVSAAFTVFKHD